MQISRHRGRDTYTGQHTHLRPEQHVTPSPLQRLPLAPPLADHRSLEGVLCLQVSIARPSFR